MSSSPLPKDLNIPYSSLLNMEFNKIKELRKIIVSCWNRETRYLGSPYFDDEPLSRGQCYVTALLVQDIFGGDIIMGRIEHHGKTEHHYWNQVFGIMLDFTSDQYGGNGFDPIFRGGGTIVRKEKLNRKNKRYLLLKKRYEECLKNTQVLVSY